MAYITIDRTGTSGIVNGVYATTAARDAAATADTGKYSVATAVADNAELDWWWSGTTLRQSGLTAMAERRSKISQGYLIAVEDYFKPYWPDDNARKATLIWLWHAAAAAATINTNAAATRLLDVIAPYTKSWYDLVVAGATKRNAWAARSIDEGATIYVDAWTATGLVERTIDADSIVLTGKTIPTGFDPTEATLGIT